MITSGIWKIKWRKLCWFETINKKERIFSNWEHKRKLSVLIFNYNLRNSPHQNVETQSIFEGPKILQKYKYLDLPKQNYCGFQISGIVEWRFLSFLWFIWLDMALHQCFTLHHFQLNTKYFHTRVLKNINNSRRIEKGFPS